MSYDLVGAALWLPLEPTRKLVLIALCERADLKTGQCFPGREEIALRSSLSTRSVTPHLQALLAEGWIKREKRGSSRLGLTTTRWLDSARILAEGEACRAQFLAQNKPEDDNLLGEDSSLNNHYQEKTAASLGEVDGIDQGKLATSLGEAASRTTVIEPSIEPSIEPLESTHRARATFGPENIRTDLEAFPEREPDGEFVRRYIREHQLTHAGNPPSASAQAAARNLERLFGAQACIQIASDYNWEKHPNWLKEALSDTSRSQQPRTSPSRGYVPGRNPRGVIHSDADQEYGKRLIAERDRVYAQRDALAASRAAAGAGG